MAVGEPVPPVRDGRGELGLRLVENGGRVAAPRQGHEGRLPLLQRRAAVAAGTGGAQAQGGRHGDHRVAGRGADRHGLVAVPLVGPDAGLGPVLEDGHDVCYHLDVALDARRQPQEGARGGGVSRRPAVVGSSRSVRHRPHHEQVLHEQPAGGGVPGRLEHHGPGDVAPVVGYLGAGGPEAEIAGCPVEQGSEDAGGVRSGEAQPLDRAVRGHQAAVLAVRDEAVVSDRGKLSAWPEATSSVTAPMLGNAGRSSPEPIVLQPMTPGWIRLPRVTRG